MGDAGKDKLVFKRLFEEDWVIADVHEQALKAALDHTSGVDGHMGGVLLPAHGVDVGARCAQVSGHESPDNFIRRSWKPYCSFYDG
jgi:hypothetical protein